MKVITYFI